MGLYHKVLSLDDPADTKNVGKAVEREITLFHKAHPSFSCIVLEEGVSGETNFCEEVSTMVDSTGTVVPLKGKSLLILLPQSKDRELVAHRLSKTLSAKVLFSCEADNPSAAFSGINSIA